MGSMMGPVSDRVQPGMERANRVRVNKRSMEVD